MAAAAAAPAAIALPASMSKNRRSPVPLSHAPSAPVPAISASPKRLSPSTSASTLRSSDSFPSIHKSKSIDSSYYNNNHSRSETPISTTLTYPSTSNFDPQLSSTSSSSTSSSTTSSSTASFNGAIESQWILSTLDDAVNRLILCSYLSPEILKDAILDVCDNEVVLALKSHFNFENQYREFIMSNSINNINNNTNTNNTNTNMTTTNTSTTTATTTTTTTTTTTNNNNESMMNKNHNELFQDLDMCLADSTRTLTRLLKKNPLLVRRLRELSAPQLRSTPHVTTLISTFSHLRSLMVSRLRQTAEEERSQREQLAELRAQEEEDSTRYQELTERLLVEKQEHTRECDAKMKKIERLQAQIAEVERRATTERLNFETRLKEEQDASDALFQSTEKELLKQVEILTQQLDSDGSENWRTEQSHHRRKNLRVLELSQLIDKYDVDMTFKHESLVDLTSIYTREARELKELTGYFKRVDAERERIQAEHIKIRKDRDVELDIHRKKSQAAMIVNMLYAPYYAKVGPKPPKPKKKKKKKDTLRPPKSKKSARNEKEEDKANNEGGASNSSSARSNARSKHEQDGDIVAEAAAALGEKNPDGDDSKEDSKHDAD